MIKILDIQGSLTDQTRSDFTVIIDVDGEAQNRTVTVWRDKAGKTEILTAHGDLELDMLSTEDTPFVGDCVAKVVLRYVYKGRDGIDLPLEVTPDLLRLRPWG